MKRRRTTASRRRDIPARVLLGILVLIAAGCQSTPPPNPHSADERLALLVEAWRRARTTDGGCDERRATGSPIVDCERIQREIHRLAIEFPRHPRVLLANAVVELESGRPEDAGKDLDLLRRLAPAMPEAAVLRARIALAEGNLRLARRVLDDQIRLSPDHPTLRELSAATYYLEERPQEAGRALSIAERLGAPAWRVAFHRGVLAESRGDLAAAARAYADCLALAPDFPPARSRLRALAVLEGLPDASGANTGPVGAPGSIE